jgi:hypothetical protein
MAEGVVNNIVQPKHTKAMDMRFHWLRDQAERSQFRIFWQPGGANLADYWTKHHPLAHHIKMRSEFLMKIKELASQRQATKQKLLAKTKLQGCVKLPVNRQSETSLDKGKNGGQILNLHMEGLLNLQKKPLELINK